MNYENFLGKIQTLNKNLRTLDKCDGNKEFKYDDYINDEEKFVKDFLNEYYPCIKIYSPYYNDSNYVGELRRYSKYNQNVQKALLYHVFIDLYKKGRFGIEQFNYYDYKKCYENITTFDDMCDIFNEISNSYVRTSTKLFNTILDKYRDSIISMNLLESPFIEEINYD